MPTADATGCLLCPRRYGVLESRWSSEAPQWGRVGHFVLPVGACRSGMPAIDDSLQLVRLDLIGAAKLSEAANVRPQNVPL